MPEEATVSLRNRMFCPRLCRAAQLAQLQWEGDGRGRSGRARDVTKEGGEAEGGEIQEKEREKRKRIDRKLISKSLLAFFELHAIFENL